MSAHILVIDDDAAVQKTLTAVLEGSGYEVQCADDGRHGVRAFRTRRPDLVICDIIIPDIEGIQTIMELRSLAPDCPIIAISGGARFGNCDFLRIARQLGVSGAVSKPFEINDLLQTVAAHLPASSSASASARARPRSVGRRAYANPDRTPIRNSGSPG
jgi:CheY-like chemotaxis protein